MTDEYKECFEKGLIYQDFVTDKLYDMGIPLVAYSSKKRQSVTGENKTGFEIKFDDQMKNTGNIYIEISEKSNASNANYVASGIYRKDNAWLYMIGDYNKLFVFGKKQLRRLIEADKETKYRRITKPTSKGFLIPVKDAEEIAVQIFNFG